MEKHKRQMKSVAAISVAPYLAEYAKKKFVLNRNNGGIIIPSRYDLYHCVWTLMQRPPQSPKQPASGEKSHRSSQFRCEAHTKTPTEKKATVPGSFAAGQSPTIPNLYISLPSRRPSSSLGSPWKDPAYYNYLSRESAHLIETELRRLFNFEFHRLMLQNEESGRKSKLADVVEDFISQYNLKSITPDALLKNYQRYRSMLRPKKPRTYTRRKHPQK